MKAQQCSFWTAFWALPHRAASVLLRDAMHPRLAAAAEQARHQGRYRRAARLFREALALATKVIWSGVVAELCWSDEPEYVAGYVATARHGSVRFPNFKRLPRCPRDRSLGDGLGRVDG